MRSLLRRTRVRLTLAYAGAFFIVATIAAGAFWITFRNIEYGSIDSSLDSQSRAVGSALDTSGGNVTFNGSDTLPGETPQGIAISAVLFDASSKVLDESGSAQHAALPSGLVKDVLSRQAQILETVTVSGQPVRLLALPVDLGNNTQGVLVLTRPTMELQDALVKVGALLGGIVVALTLVVSALGYGLAGRALRPVRIMSDTARHISEHDLHRRLSLDLPPDELGQLAATFNDMLARLENAFATLQRFTADAAHELRAPLALLRAELEVSLKRLRTAEEYRASERMMLAEVERLSRLADQLLMLARADSGTLTPAPAPLDLPDLVEEIVDRWQAVARRRSVDLQAVVDAEGTVDADRELLRRLIDNLLDNAIRYTAAGGTVRVAVDRDAALWHLTVADTGPGVAPSLRATLFDRFTRGDGARGRDSGGAGLGLSLCRAIVEAHGGSIGLRDDQTPGATIVVSLPAPPSTA